MSKIHTNISLDIQRREGREVADQRYEIAPTGLVLGDEISLER